MSNVPALIITIIVTVLAVVALVYAVFVIRTDDGRHQSVPGEFDETAEKVEIPDEMYTIAGKLVKNNFDVYNLFYLYTYDETSDFEHVYQDMLKTDNEDKYYILKPGLLKPSDAEYKTVEELFALIDATYAEDVAESIKGYEELTGYNGAVYKDVDGKVGVNKDFEPIEYGFALEFVDLELHFISENEYLISVTMTDKSTGEKNVKKRSMRLTDGEWLLEDLLY